MTLALNLVLMSLVLVGVVAPLVWAIIGQRKAQPTGSIARAPKVATRRAPSHRTAVGRPNYDAA